MTRIKVIIQTTRDAISAIDTLTTRRWTSQARTVKVIGPRTAIRKTLTIEKKKT